MCISSVFAYKSPSVSFLPDNLPKVPIEVRADYFGGYTISNPNTQQRTEVRSDGLDGYTYYDVGRQKMHQIRPDGFGGFKIY